MQFDLLTILQPITVGKRQNKRIDHLRNIQTVLSSLRANGLKLTTNCASELADGNPTATRELIWQCIRHFQVFPTLMDF